MCSCPEGELCPAFTSCPDSQQPLWKRWGEPSRSALWTQPPRCTEGPWAGGSDRRGQPQPALRGVLQLTPAAQRCPGCWASLFCGRKPAVGPSGCAPAPRPACFPRTCRAAAGHCPGCPQVPGHAVRRLRCSWGWAAGPYRPRGRRPQAPPARCLAQAVPAETWSSGCPSQA